MNYNDPSKNYLRPIVIPYFLCDETYPFNLCCNLGPNQSVYAFIPFFGFPKLKPRQNVFYLFFILKSPFGFVKLKPNFFS